MADAGASHEAQSQSAKCYSEKSSFQRDSGYHFIEQLSPGRGFRVLDFGCGTGALAAVLSECVGPEGKVIAVDPDEERLKIAREKYARDNIEFVNGNDATFPEGPYDLVFASQVIHWVKDKEALFGRVFENLKSGGIFAFTTGNGAPVPPPVATSCLIELFGSDFLDKVYHKTMVFLTCDQYRELAKSHKFVVTSTEDKEVPLLVTDSVDSLIEFHLGLLQGELDRETITKEAVQSCKDKYEDELHSEAKLRHTIKVLHVVLTKP